MLTVKQISERARVSVSEVNRQIKIGMLKATFNMDAKRNEITEADFAAWDVSRRKRGRPKGKS